MLRWVKWAGVVLLVVLGLAMSGLVRPRGNIVTLKDGTRLIFHQATYGLGFAPPPRFRPPWLDRSVGRLPMTLQRLLPPTNPQPVMGGSLDGEGRFPVVTIWFSHLDAQTQRTLASPGPFRWQPVPGESPTMRSFGNTQIVQRGDINDYLHGFSFVNGGKTFGGKTNLFSSHDRKLRFAILDLRGQRLGVVELPNPAYGQKGP